MLYLAKWKRITVDQSKVKKKKSTVPFFGPPGRVYTNGSMTYAPTTNAPARNANVEAYINPDPIPNPNPNPNPYPALNQKTQSYPWV